MSGPSEVRALMSMSRLGTMRSRWMSSRLGAYFGEIEFRYTSDDIRQLSNVLESVYNLGDVYGQSGTTYLSRRSSLNERGSNFNCAHSDCSMENREMSE